MRYLYSSFTKAKAEVSLQRIFDSLDVSNLDCVDDLGYEEMLFFSHQMKEIGDVNLRFPKYESFLFFKCFLDGFERLV